MANALVVGAIVASVAVAHPGHGQHGDVNWQALQLTPQQNNAMQQLDRQWEGTYQRLHPQIEHDQAQLRQLMEAPNASPQRVMQVQNRLQRNRHQLHQSATRIFMKKKHRLTPPQRKELSRMMHPKR